MAAHDGGRPRQVLLYVYFIYPAVKLTRRLSSMMQGRPESQKTLDSQHPLLSSVPYDKRSKTKHKPHERRPILDLTDASPSPDAPEATDSQSLPGQRYNDRTTTYAPFSCDGPKTAPQTISEYQKLCRFQSAPQKPLRPYVRNHDLGAGSFAVPVSCTHQLLSGRSSELRSHQSSAMASSSSVGACHLVNTQSGDVTRKRNKADGRRPMYGPTVNEEKQKRTESYLHQRWYVLVSLCIAT